MAYLERSAMVRISTITNSTTALTTATLLPVTPLNYPNNTHVKQEESRLAFTQLMTTRRTSGYDGFFTHVVRTDEYSTLTADNLPHNYRAAFERPVVQGTASVMPEMSCSLVSTSSADDVGIQTLTSNYYNDNAVDNSILIEVS